MDFIDKLDRIAIRIYNWIIIKFLVMSYIIIVISVNFVIRNKDESVKDVIKEANEFVAIFTAAVKTSKTNYKS